MKEVGRQGIRLKSIVISKELEETQKVMPISKEDKERLEESIRKEGVRDPIKGYKKDGIFHLLAGFNRLEIFTKIAKETKKAEWENEEIIAIILEGKPEEFRDFTINDNLERRHFTREQKTDLINYFLKIDPTQSDNQIAKKTKSDNKTVNAKRKILESRKEIPNVEKVDSKGRKVGEKPKGKSNTKQSKKANDSKPVKVTNSKPSKAELQDRLKEVKAEIKTLKAEEGRLEKQLGIKKKKVKK